MQRSQMQNRQVKGAIAQLGEHLLCKQGVVGSIPTGSTKLQSISNQLLLWPIAYSLLARNINISSMLMFFKNSESCKENAAR